MSGIMRHPLARHILLAIGLTIVLLVLTGWLLRVYTRHGKEVAVPDFTGLTMPEIEQQAAAADFDIIVNDSIFDLEKKKGSVAFQEPPAGSIVKKNRSIYLTLVATRAEMVIMPDLRDLTHRQALATLESFGLLPGRTEFVPDLAHNAVLAQHYKGSIIAPGKPVEKGSRIDLVVGKGSADDVTSLPLLLGMTRAEAIRALEEAFLTPGRETFEDGRDTLHARVYRQSPAFHKKPQVSSGQAVDLWYRSDKKFDFKTFMDNYRRDSLGGGEGDLEIDM